MRRWTLRCRASVEGLPPERAALLLSVGLVLGVFPIMGFPTVLCLLAAFGLRLNFAALQVLNNFSSPLQLALLLPFTRAGAWLCGGAVPDGGTAAGKVGAAAVHALAGWGCICVPSGILLYLVLILVMRRRRPVWSNTPGFCLGCRHRRAPGGRQQPEQRFVGPGTLQPHFVRRALARRLRPLSPFRGGHPPARRTRPQLLPVLHRVGAHRAGTRPLFRRCAGPLPPRAGGLPRKRRQPGERSARHLGDLISSASTFNEPNLPMLLRWISHIDVPFTTVMRMSRQAARAIGAGQFGCFFLGDGERLQQHMIAAHHRAVAALKAGPGAYPVGVNLALQDERAVGPGRRRDKKCAEVYEPWLEAASRSDFLGIQTYTRCRVGKKGDLGPEPGVELTQMAYEFWPDAVEACLRYAATRVRIPIYITESGIATGDDVRRIEYIRQSLTGVLRCLADGIDVRGYIHWSLLDNFEWIYGYRPKFGLIAVDRATQQRSVKPSARYLGEIARRNRMPDPVAIG